VSRYARRIGERVRALASATPSIAPDSYAKFGFAGLFKKQNPNDFLHYLASFGIFRCERIISKSRRRPLGRRTSRLANFHL
jgi:hypothetical protein